MDQEHFQEIEFGQLLKPQSQNIIKSQFQKICGAFNLPTILGENNFWPASIFYNTICNM